MSALWRKGVILGLDGFSDNGGKNGPRIASTPTQKAKVLLLWFGDVFGERIRVPLFHWLLNQSISTSIAASFKPAFYQYSTVFKTPLVIRFFSKTMLLFILDMILVFGWR